MRRRLRLNIVLERVQLPQAGGPALGRTLIVGHAGGVERERAVRRAQQERAPATLLDHRERGDALGQAL